MKRIISLLLCLLLLAGCTTKTNDPWGIQLETKKISTSIGLTLACSYDEVENIETLKTNSYYKLQRKDKSTWNDLPVKYDTYQFEEKEYVLNGEDVVWELQWSDLYGSIAKGRYRVVKTIECIDKEGNKESKDYYVEFAVTDVCRTCLK